jgi:hypothetical protein
LEPISVDISDQLQQITVSVYKDGSIPTPKKLAVALVATIESLGINTINMAHGS